MTNDLYTSTSLNEDHSSKVLKTLGFEPLSTFHAAGSAGIAMRVEGGPECVFLNSTQSFASTSARPL
jgi:hypothetical protein